MASTSAITEYKLNKGKKSGRLAEQHGAIKDAKGGSLVVAPVDPSQSGLRMLHAGTTNALWLRDLGSSLASTPSDPFVGTDTSGAPFPQDVPSGTSFHVQPIHDAWPAEWAGSFDHVYQRLTLVGAGPATKEAVVRLTELVKPGGWIQLIEAEQIVGPDDGPAMHHFLALMKEVGGFMGSGTDVAPKMAGWIRDAGFVKVEESVARTMLGASNKDPESAARGVASTVAAVTGLVGYAKSVSRPLSSLSPDELDTLVPRLKAELTERGGCYPMRVVWGQRPAA